MIDIQTSAGFLRSILKYHSTRQAYTEVENRTGCKMVLQVDNVFEGCSIRGLPIGVPFRTKVTIPDNRETDVNDRSHVLIISQFKDMQGDQEIVDIIPDKVKYKLIGKNLMESAIDKPLQSDNELNINHRTTAGDNVVDWSDVESTTVETEMFFNDMATDSDMSLDMDCNETCTAGMLSNLTRKKVKQKLKQKTKNVEKIKKYILSGSKKHKRSKRHHSTSKSPGSLDVNFSSPPKLKKIEKTDDDTGKSCRRSARNRSLGFRPDYEAIETISDDMNEDSDYDFDNTQYDTKYNNVDDNMYLLKTKAGESGEDDDNDSMNGIDEGVDIKPCINDLKKVISDSKAKNSGHKKKPRMGPKSKVMKQSESDADTSNKPKKVIDEDPDFILEGVSDIEGAGDNDDDDDVEIDRVDKPDKPKVKKIRKRKRKIKMEDLNDENESSLASTSDGKHGPGRPRLDPAVRRMRKLESRRRAAERAKLRGEEAKRHPKKEVTEDDENKEKDPSYVERLKLQKALAKQEKAANRIKIKLQDHPDMYRMDFMESYERRNRGKSIIETGLELFVCAICNKYKTDNKEALEMHLEMHANGELSCDLCGYVGCYPAEVMKHKRTVHKFNVCICDECGMECSGQDGLKDHLGKDHDRPQYPCKHCEEKGNKQTLLTLYHFRKHLRTEHSDKLLRCEKCKKLFATKGMRTRHLSIGCEGDGPVDHPCDKCGKTFSSQIGVQRHIDRVHNKIRSFPCPKCSFTATRPCGLKQHLLVHAGYHPFKCDQCSYSCVQKFQLISHMRTHTGEKPYKCTECSYAAAWKVQLKEHMKIHNVSISNTVNCNKCGQVFRDFHTFKAHLFKEHSQGGSKTVKKAEKEETSATPTQPPDPPEIPYHQQVQPFPEDLSAQHFASMPYYQPYN